MQRFLLIAAFIAFAAASDVVQILGQQSLDDFIANTPFGVVEFYAPWCGHCQQLAPHYAEAAKALKNDEHPVLLAACDMTLDENKDLGEKFGIRGFPTLKIFKKSAVSDYNGPRTTEGIIKYLRDQAGPAVEHLEGEEIEEQLVKLKTNNKVVAFALVESDSDKKELEIAAELVRDSVKVVSSSLADAPADVSEKARAAPALVIFKTFDEDVAVYSGAFKSADLAKYIKDESLLTFGKIAREEPDVINAFSTTERKKFILIVNGKTTEQVDVVKGLPAAIAGTPLQKELFIGWVDGPEFPQAMSHFGVEEKDLPAAILFDNDDGKFKFDQKWETKSLVEFGKNVLDGKVAAFFKSEPVVDNTGKNLKIVVRDSYDEIVVKSDANVFLKVYAPWCGHCKNMIPAIEALADAFSDEPSVVIAKVDATANDLPSSLGVAGFPTLLWFPKGDKKNPVKYEGGRNTIDMLNFIKKSAGASLKIKEVAGAAADSADEDIESPANDGDFVEKITTALDKKYFLNLNGWIWASIAAGLIAIAIVLLATSSSPAAPPAANAKKTPGDAKKEAAAAAPSKKNSKKD